MTPAGTARAEDPQERSDEEAEAVPTASTTIETEINMVIGCYILPPQIFYSYFLFIDDISRVLHKQFVGQKRQFSVDRFLEIVHAPYQQ